MKMKGSDMSRSSRTFAPLLGSLLALLALVFVVLGVPIALLAFVGVPVPSPVPNLQGIGDIFAGRAPIPADYLVSVLAIVLWILWVQVAWATWIEVLATVRGRLAASVMVLPGLQTTIGKLVTAATLLASLGAKPVAAGPLPAVATVVESSLEYRTSPAPDERLERPVTSDPVPYLTRQGDTWWGIAENTLGSGTRWKEIRGLNIGRSMADGHTISVSTDLLRPEWRLLLPPSANVSQVPVDEPAPASATSSPTPGKATAGTRHVVVEPGDTVWGIAKVDLADQLDGTAEPGRKIAAHVDEIADVNAEMLAGDPDMILPGQTLALPGLDGTIGRLTPADDVAPTDDGSSSSAVVVPDRLVPTPHSAPGDESDSATPEPTDANPSGSVAGAAADSDSELVDGGEPPDDGLEEGSVAPPVTVDDRTDSEEERSAGMPASATADRDTSLDIQLPVNDAIPPLRSIGPPIDVGADEVASNFDGGDALATENDRAPVFAGIAALTLVGAYLYRARGRRRDTALRHRHPGKMPKQSKGPTKTLARRLSAAAGPEHPEFVNVGLRALGHQLRTVPARRLPEIAGVWVSHNRLVIALTDDSPRIDPPEPFTDFVDGSGWSLHRSNFGRAKELARGANGPMPLLTTLGTTSALDLSLTTGSRDPADAYGLSTSLLFAIDLEPGRVISIEADDDRARLETLAMMALELATSETADQAEIVCVGFGSELAELERVLVIDRLAEIMPDLESVTSRAVYAAADASPFATRVGGGAADTWNPVIVMNANPADEYADSLIDLADRTIGGVTAICGYPARVGWTIEVTGDRLRCPDLYGDLGDHEFTRPELDGIDLISDLLEESGEEVELDDEFWNTMDPQVIDLTAVGRHPDGDGSIGAGMNRGMVRSGPGTYDQTMTMPAEGTDPSGLSSGDVPHEPGTQHQTPQVHVGADPTFDDKTSWRPMPTVTEPSPADPSAPSVDPEMLWDEVSHIDPGTWPPSESQPSLYHWPDSEDQGSSSTSDSSGASRSARSEFGPPIPRALRHSTQRDSDTPQRPRQSAAAVESVRALRPSGAGKGPLPVVHVTAESPPESSGEEADHQTLDNGDDTPSIAHPTDSRSVESSSADSPEEVPPNDVDTAVRVSILGPLTIEGHHVGDRRKPWKYTKTPELILYLLLYPAGASQDLLMERLFPEQPPNRPRLNQLISDARTKALGLNVEGEYHLPHASPTEPFYQLLPTVGFDLRDFARHCAQARQADHIDDQRRSWTAALELVRGRPFTLPHDGYEWALPEIEATIVKVEEAAAALTDIAFELGDHALAVWATKQGLRTGTGYYDLLAKRGKAALLLQDPEEIVRAFADLQTTLECGGAPEEGTPDFGTHPELADIYDQLSVGRGPDRPGRRSEDETRR